LWCVTHISWYPPAVGLREQNAARARQVMVDAAMELFLDVGFDATTMEGIALRAGVGSSTLYRYFDSKDAMVLAPLGEPGVMAARLRQAPADQPLAEALGAALVALLVVPRDDVVSDERYRELIRTNPRAQSRLLEWYHEEERLLREAIAEREHRGAEDLGVFFTARAATLVLELATDDTAADAGGEVTAERARALMRALEQETITLPRVSG
jgi:AcrR family transcriptional regulator